MKAKKKTKEEPKMEPIEQKRELVLKISEGIGKIADEQQANDADIMASCLLVLTGVIYRRYDFLDPTVVMEKLGEAIDEICDDANARLEEMMKRMSKDVN